MAIMEHERGGRTSTLNLNDPKLRALIYQIAAIAAVVIALIWIGYNAAVNLAAQHKTTGFDFLFRTAGFNVSFSLFPFDRNSYYWQAFLVGLTNTLLVSFLAIIAATVLGFLIGIGRLSSNWLVARAATLYIEIVRNIPLLLQLFFWYFAVLKAMPAVKQSHVFLGSIVLNQRGLYVPKPIFGDHVGWMFGALLVAIVICVWLRRWARQRFERSGERFPVFWTSLALLVMLPGIVWILGGAQLSFDMPELQGFNYRGGVELPPEFVALVFGLSIYTASFIAETVRAGILSVNKGQTEAAQALGLKEGDRLRLVVIPQAMRVIIPPLTSQYLNLTKNSSLGAAIAFPELVSVFTGTTLNQTGKAIEVISLTMLVYLTLSLTTAGIMNWYNARVALVER